MEILGILSFLSFFSAINTETCERHPWEVTIESTWEDGNRYFFIGTVISKFVILSVGEFLSHSTSISVYPVCPEYRHNSKSIIKGYSVFWDHNINPETDFSNLGIIVLTESIPLSRDLLPIQLATTCPQKGDTVFYTNSYCCENTNISRRIDRIVEEELTFSSFIMLESVGHIKECSGQKGDRNYGGMAIKDGNNHLVGITTSTEDRKRGEVQATCVSKLAKYIHNLQATIELFSTKTDNKPITSKKRTIEPKSETHPTSPTVAVHINPTQKSTLKINDEPTPATTQKPQIKKHIDTQPTISTTQKILDKPTLTTTRKPQTKKNIDTQPTIATTQKIIEKPTPKTTQRPQTKKHIDTQPTIATTPKIIDKPTPTTTRKPQTKKNIDTQPTIATTQKIIDKPTPTTTQKPQTKPTPKTSQQTIATKKVTTRPIIQQTQSPWLKLMPAIMPMIG